MNESNHPVRVDPESGALVITGLRIVEPDVLAECRHWSQGRRGAAVEMGELAGADLTAFAEQALVIGSTALAAAAGVQQRYGIEALVAEVEHRSTEAAACAAERTAAAVTQASTRMEQATEASRRAILEAGTSARTAFAGSVASAQQDLSAQIGALLGGEQSQVMLRLQPLLDQFGRSLEERTRAQTAALLDRVSKEFDPADPCSPMAQQMRALKDTQAVYAAAAADQQRVVVEKLDGLTAGLQTSQAVDRALARTAAKGATYEEQVHALLAEIAGGLGDEYAETGTVVGLRTRSKKGDGVLRVPDPEARVVVEMTDSPRSGWVDYLKEAEDNRGAQAALGLVRSAAQLTGGPILTLGPRRVVMAFDPLTDDPHLLRCVIQLLRLAAIGAAARVENGELATADEHLAAALETLQRISTIRKHSGAIKSSATTIDREAEGLQSELARLLARARTALAGIAMQVHDDVA